MKVGKEYFINYYNQKIRPEILKFTKQHKVCLEKFNKQAKNVKPKSLLSVFIMPTLKFLAFFILIFIFSPFNEALFNKAPMVAIALMIFSVLSIPLLFVGSGIKFVLDIFAAINVFLPFYNNLTSLSELESQIKKAVMPVFCQMFKNLKWCHGTYQNRLQIFNSKVIPAGFDYKKGYDLDDIFYGVIDDVRFEIIELKVPLLSNIVSNNIPKEQEMISSIVLKIDTNKKFNNHTLVYPSYCEKPLDFIETQLEDVVFEYKYNVYTHNETEARYLITPKFMEALNNAKRVLKCEDICCSFYNNNLFVLLDYKVKSENELFGHDLFSVNIYNENIDDVHIYMKIFSELTNFLKVINYFKRA